MSVSSDICMSVFLANVVKPLLYGHAFSVFQSPDLASYAVAFQFLKSAGFFAVDREYDIRADNIAQLNDSILGGVTAGMQVFIG